MTNLLKDKKFGSAKLLSNTSRFFNYKHFASIMNNIYTTDLIAERNRNNDKVVEYLHVELS